MTTRITVYLAFVAIFTVLTIPAQAIEPTWLFSVPKAESLETGAYNVGLLYAEFGLAENLEIGIHGLKYSLPESNLALGLSTVPAVGPYIVTSLDAGSGKLHLGVKAVPNWFFAGLETPVSDNVNFVAELNDGVFAGVRIFPARKWTLDIFATFINVEVYRYRYRYGWIETEDFRPGGGILFAYSDRF